MRTAVLDVDTPSPVPALPELARMPAINRLVQSLMSRGTHEHTARAIAYAVCDPSAFRRQLEQPSEIRVSAGVLQVVHTRVWVPAILPYPENPRMLPGLTYAVEGRADRRRPLTPARAADDPNSAELVMSPVAPTELVGYLDSQLRYLRDNNDLSTSVGNHGIREELLLVPLAFETLINNDDYTEDRAGHSGSDSHQGWTTVLTAVDGNSRLAGAYHHLRLDPSEFFTRHMDSPRALRQRIGTTLALDSAEGLAGDAAAALRSVTAPAAVVIGYAPDDDTSTVADAIQSRLGALHVAPAKAWSPASQYDLLLNVSLEAMHERFDDWAHGQAFTGPQYQSWLAGDLDASAAGDLGLDRHPDVRAAALRWWLHKRDPQISAAIRKLDVVRVVTPLVRANMAAEGALRSFRSGLSATEADNARRVLATLWEIEDLRGVWSTDDRLSLGSLVKLRSKATAEVAATGRPGPNGRLLMVLAFYWMARYRLVPLQTRGGMEDRRNVTAVITLMCHTEHGMRQLARMVADGRAGRTPRRVDPEGDPIVGADGKDLPFTDEWMRLTWSSGTMSRPVISPEADLQNRQERLVEAAENLNHALIGLREPLAGDGTPLVDTIGMEVRLANRVLEALDTVSETVMEYRFIAKWASL